MDSTGCIYMSLYAYMCFYVCLHLYNNSNNWRPWMWEEVWGCMNMGEIWGRGGWNEVNTVLMYDVLKKNRKNNNDNINRQTKTQSYLVFSYTIWKNNRFDLQMYLELYKKSHSLIIFPFSSSSMIQHWGLPFWKCFYTCHLKGNILYEIDPPPMAFRTISEKKKEDGSRIMRRGTNPACFQMRFV